jgi:hypothetical protein
MDFAGGRSVVSPRPVESNTASYYPLKRFKRAPWTRERRRERRRDRFREGKQRLGIESGRRPRASQLRTHSGANRGSD